MKFRERRKEIAARISLEARKLFFFKGNFRASQKKKKAHVKKYIPYSLGSDFPYQMCYKRVSPHSQGPAPKKNGLTLSSDAVRG